MNSNKKDQKERGYIASYKQHSNDLEFTRITEEGMSDYLGQLEKLDNPLLK